MPLHNIGSSAFITDVVYDLHCFGPAKPFTGGCVGIPEEHMKYVMQHVDENTVVVIDTYEALSGTTEWPDSLWPKER